MTLPAALVLLGLFPSAHAADLCKGFDVSTDKFGGGTNVEAVIQKLGQFTAIGMTLALHTSVVELSVTVKEAGAINGVVPIGQEVPFLFGESQVLKLLTSREGPRQAYTTGAAIFTNSTYMFTLTTAQLAMIAGAPLSSIRFPLASGPYDWDARKAIQKDLLAAATCIQQFVK